VILWPQRFVTLPRVGTLRVWATSADSLHAATLHPRDKQSADYRDKPDAQHAAESTRIHGVDYRLLLHLRRVRDEHSDGDAAEATWCGWAIATDGIVLRRADDDTTPGSKPARRHVVAVIFPALAKWAASPPAGPMLAVADRHDARQRLDQVEAEIDQLKRRLAEREAERDQLRDKLQ